MKSVSMLLLVVALLGLVTLQTASAARNPARGVATYNQAVTFSPICGNCNQACAPIQNTYSASQWAYTSPAAFATAQGDAFSTTDNIQTCYSTTPANHIDYSGTLGSLPGDGSCPNVLNRNHTRRQSNPDPNTGYIDWTANGLASPVIQQGRCASCWAIATAEHFEYYSFFRNGRQNFQRVAYQQLMDCSSTNATGGQAYGNSGCQTGWPVYAMWFIQDRGQLATWGNYPYTNAGDGPSYQSANGYCSNSAGLYTPHLSVGAVQRVVAGSESALTDAISSQTVVVAVFASTIWWEHYTSGILWDPVCTQNQGKVNHAVLAVGYGSSQFNVNGHGMQTLYWYRIKNSNGVSWGENGYMRLVRYGWNNCDVASYAFYLA